MLIMTKLNFERVCANVRRFSHPQYVDWSKYVYLNEWLMSNRTTVTNDPIGYSNYLLRFSFCSQITVGPLIFLSRDPQVLLMPGNLAEESCSITWDRIMEVGTGSLCSSNVKISFIFEVFFNTSYPDGSTGVNLQKYLTTDRSLTQNMHLLERSQHPIYNMYTV